MNQHQRRLKELRELRFASNVDILYEGKAISTIARCSKTYGQLESMICRGFGAKSGYFDASTNAQYGCKYYRASSRPAVTRTLYFVTSEPDVVVLREPLERKRKQQVVPNKDLLPLVVIICWESFDPPTCAALLSECGAEVRHYRGDGSSVSSEECALPAGPAPRPEQAGAVTRERVEADRFAQDDYVVAGRIFATAFAVHSDARVKMDIEAMKPNVLDKLSSIGSYVYTYNHQLGNGDLQHIGLLAQEVQRQFPQAVLSQSDGTLAVDYAQLVPVVMQAVRELNATQRDHGHAIDLLHASNVSHGQAIEQVKATQQEHQEAITDLQSNLTEVRSLVVQAPPPATPQRQDVFLPSVRHFTGRWAELELIRQHLEPLQSGTRNGVVISGIAGQGKTQLALRFARQQLTDYKLVWCLFAADESALMHEFVQLGRECGALTANATVDSEAVAIVKRWLCSNGPWLIVLDNMEDRSFIEKFVPTRTGHVVITSRNANSSVWPFTMMNLERLVEDDCVSLFSLLNEQAEVDQELKAMLTQDLQGHALSISVAACYVRDTGCGISWFRSQLPVVDNREGQYPDCLQTVIRLAWEKLSPLAQMVMGCAAFLNPADIPFVLLSELSAQMDTLILLQTLHELRKQSLVTTSKEVCGIHPLVQRCIRLLPDALQYCNMANAALLRLFNANDATTPSCYRLRVKLTPHAFAVWNHQLTLEGLDVHDVPSVSWLWWLCEHHTFVSDACQLTELLRGKLDCEELLARFYGEVGKFKEAIAIFKDILQVNQPHDSIRARIMGSLAATYAALGLHQEALTMNEQTLALHRELCGDEHPDVATSMNNLASTYSALGRHQQALALQEQTLALRRKLFGDEHPDFATSMSNLALTYFALGRHQEALALHEKTLSLRRKLFGDEHPAVAKSMGNLASTYSALGCHQEALALKEQTLALNRKLFGDEHPAVALSMNNVASTYSALGGHQEALALNEQTLALNRKLFGDEHRDVAVSMSNLAFTYSELGRHQAALALVEQTLALLRKLCGDEHPDVATSMNNLAVTYSVLGRHQEALALKGQTLALRRSLFVDEHPNVATSMGNLASTYSALGRRDEAVIMCEQALAMQRKLLGDHHPDVKRTAEKLSRFLQATVLPAS